MSTYRSSDTMNGPTIRRMRGKVLDVHAEHWWYRSSRCAGGDCVLAFWAGNCVNVVDTNLGPASPIQRWPVELWEELLYAVDVGVDHAGVDRLEDGSVRLGLVHAQHELLTFTSLEWLDFTIGVQAKKYDAIRLCALAPRAVRGRGHVVELSHPASVAVDGAGHTVEPAGRPGFDREVVAGAATVRRLAVPVAAASDPVPNEEDASLIWTEDPTLGEPQGLGVDKGAARRAGQGPGFADRSGVEAAGTGALPPVLVPVADEIGDIVLNRTGDKVTVVEAPEYARIALSALRWSDDEYLTVIGVAGLLLGVDEAGSPVTYRVIGWDDGLLVHREPLVGGP